MPTSVVRPHTMSWLAGILAIGPALALPANALPAGSADSTAAPLPPMRTVVAGKQYGANTVHRFLLGGDYRVLWTTPVTVRELDLRNFKGGLRPVKRVGGQQTPGLALKGADGRDYTFRGLDKDPSEILPAEFRDTFIDKLLQDQIASSFPGGAVAVPPLLQAAGVLHAEPYLVVMPDDSLLGEFRPAFAGLLGTFEEFPRTERDGTPGFAGATEIIDGEEMWKRMDESPSTRPDSRNFLAARLVDNLIGDWDRHRNQWRWAKLPGDEQWQPIPEDRDQAFVLFEGLVPALGRPRFPQFVSFGEEYPDIEGLTWNGRDVDRRILVDLEKSTWTEVATELQSHITDLVIAEAIARIPEAYRAIEGATLESALKQRRDDLVEAADRYYRFLACDVDVRATSQDEIVGISCSEDGDVAVSVELAPTPGSDPPAGYRRLFHADETEEVRIYLGGGADHVVASGKRGKITVRVIGGDGSDTIDDPDGVLRVSDSDGELDLVRGPGTQLDTRPYTPPKRTKAEWIPPRDWGRRTIWFPWIGGNSDLGVLFLVGVRTEGFGFRKDPDADNQTFRLGYATRAGALGADYTGLFHRENSPLAMKLYVRASGLDLLHYYGFGNETPDPGDEDFYKVENSEYAIVPSLLIPFDPNWTAALHLNAKYARTKLHPNQFITENPPYGASYFLQYGAGASLTVDTRDSEVAATRGFRVTADGTVFPPMGDVESTFGEVTGEATFFQPISIATTPVLALRAGGKRLWGDYPYYEAAYVGGARTVRGFASQRFAGDASLFGSAELRIPLARVYVFVPGSLGVFALGDAGRVYLKGEASNKWHVAAGGGVWFTVINPANTASISVASSDEGTRVYILAGLGF